MKKQFYILASLLIMISASIISCSKTVQSLDPEIFFVAPENEDLVQIGGEYGVHMEGEIITRGSFLKEYILSVYPTFPATELGDSAAYIFNKIYKPSFEKIREENIHNHDIKIPLTVDKKPVKMGWYYIKLEAEDRDGRSSNVTKRIYLTYEDQGHSH